MGDSGSTRACAGCGRPLSRYNTGKRCQACVSAARQQSGDESPGDSGAVVDGAKLAHLRREREWTQEMLADRSGLSVQLVRKVEQNRGPVLLGTLGKLARALDVPFRTFLAGDDIVISPEGPAELNQPTLVPFSGPAQGKSSQDLLDISGSGNSGGPPSGVTGDVLRAWRRAYGWDKPQLTRLLRQEAMSRGDPAPEQHSLVRMVHYWETGQRPLGERYELLYAAVLGIRPDLLAAGPPGYSPPCAAEGAEGARLEDDGVTWLDDSAEDLSDPMRRRSFFVSTAALAGLLRTDPVTAFEAARYHIVESIPGRLDFDAADWGNLVQEYGEIFAVTPAAELVGPLLSDFSGLGEAFQHYRSESVQRELFRVTALMAGFLAQTINKLGHAHEARQWWRVARQAADRSGDNYSSLWVRSREIMHATIPLSGRPVATVLRLAGDAERYASTAPPEASLEFLAAKAETFAMAGREDEARQTLSLLHRNFEASGFSGPGGSLLAWGEERLRTTEIYIFSRLGDYGKLEAASAAACKHDLSNYIWPVNNEMHKAFCLVRLGDVSQGTLHARTVVDGLPGVRRDRVIYRRALEISKIAPIPARDEPAMGEYREWISSTFAGQPALSAG